MLDQYAICECPRCNSIMANDRDGKSVVCIHGHRIYTPNPFNPATVLKSYAEYVFERQRIDAIIDGRPTLKESITKGKANTTTLVQVSMYSRNRINPVFLQIGRIIFEARKAHGMSQPQLAREMQALGIAGIIAAVISQYELGYACPIKATALAIDRILGTGIAPQCPEQTRGMSKYSPTRRQLHG